MDPYHSKGNANRVGVSVRTRLALGYGNHDPRRYQCCNRLGCSINSMSGGQIETPKHLPANIRSSGSKAIAGNSSRIFSSPIEVRKLQKRSQTSTSSKEISFSSSSHSEEFMETPDSSTLEDQTITSEREEMEDAYTPHNTSSTENSFEEIGKLPAIHGSSSRSYHRTNLGNHSFPRVSSGQTMIAGKHSFSSRNHGEPSKVPPGFGYNSSRYGLGHLNHTSISKVLSSQFSVASTKGFNPVGKSDGCGSSGRERNINNTSPVHHSSSNMSPRSNSSSLHFPRRTNRPLTQWGVTSVRTRQPHTDSPRLSESSSNSSVSSQSHSSLTTESQSVQSNNSANSGNSASLASMDLPSYSRNSFETTPFGTETSRSRRTTWHESSNSHRLTDLSINRDGYRRRNMGGIPEILLALGRVEQDEELAYEQLLIPETNLLLGGLNFHDQHRDLRMDIDNMTYEEHVMSRFVCVIRCTLKVHPEQELIIEFSAARDIGVSLDSWHTCVYYRLRPSFTRKSLKEYINIYTSKQCISASRDQELLALEERMGSVSTALSEESLSKYLRRYSVDLAVSESKSCDDVKCSICQEEYGNGAEVGCLQCDHGYHVSCISEWLGMKNWCPVCKAPAATK